MVHSISPWKSDFGGRNDVTSDSWRDSSICKSEKLDRSDVIVSFVSLYLHVLG